MPKTAASIGYLQKTYPLHDLQGMIRAVEEEGFALLPGVLSHQEVLAARKNIDQLQPIHWDRVGGANEHFKNVFNQNTFFLDFIDRAPTIDLAESVMGEQ